MPKKENISKIKRKTKKKIQKKIHKKNQKQNNCAIGWSGSTFVVVSWTEEIWQKIYVRCEPIGASQVFSCILFEQFSVFHFLPKVKEKTTKKKQKKNKNVGNWKTDKKKEIFFLNKFPYCDQRMSIALFKKRKKTAI